MPNTVQAQADLLIVTVTRLEARAVLTAFEGATGQKAQAVSIGDRVYRDLGSLNGTRAFLALSEMGAMGLGASLQAISKGIAALHPRAVIMVGIAFGMNESKQALGDILVARQLMLYEAQRVGSAQLVARGDRVHGSSWLINYLTSAELDWTGATVRFGLMLTGEKLVDNLDYREGLKRLEGEAIGGEMEGAGLYVACQDAKVDWVLVKAICDWADGNKAQDKDARQERAAKNAADFVVHALRHARLLREGAEAPGTPMIPSGSKSAGPRQEVGSIVVSGTGNSVVLQQSQGAGPSPGAAALPASARPRTRQPTRNSLRALLGAVLRTSPDLQSYLIDWFPDVARQVGGGMTRNECEDILFQKEDADTILARLRDHDPVRTQKHESLLVWVEA